MSHLRAVPDGPTGPRESSTPPPRSGSASSVRVEAPGKVNLFLSVGAPGTDGYHPLTTVFQAVRLIETVTARRQSAQDHGTVTLTLEEPDADVPVDESNLAVRAATLLAQTTGVSEGVDLLLRKRVPVAGGMAGGSADAAAALVACNALWGTGLSLPELSALAARLGADVPFPLTGATAVGSGRGDLVTPIMTRGAYHWVFALAEEGLSTPAVFRRFDELTGGGQPTVRDVPEALTAALRAGDARALAGSLHNDLQAAALDLRPELAEVIAVAEEAGALRAIVSGSGPTIAALVEDWGLLLKCLVSSGLLFLTGYAIGSAAGFLTGFYMGWSRRGDYWLHPVLQTVGPVPAAALLPLAVLVVPTTYLSAASIVAFGAWFPMATMTRAGVRAVPRSFIDVARTLGADESFLVRRIAIPSALPDMLTGLFTGLGTSLAALMTAELVGVDQGLAWYINWVKGWADYPKMYVGLTVLVLFCRALMLLLFKIRSSLLAWQRDLVRW